MHASALDGAKEHEKEPPMTRGSDPKVDVLFVIPPLLRFVERSSSSFPLGLGYLVSSLGEAGITARIYNADVYREPHGHRIMRFISRLINRHIPLFEGDNVDFAKRWPDYHQEVNNPYHDVWQDVEIVFKKIQPRIIAISSKIVDLPSTLFVVSIVKRVLPGIPIIIGGPSASTFSDYLMKQEGIDYLVYGEGEETVTELCTHLLTPKGHSTDRIQGIIYRAGDTTIRNPPRHLIPNLDTIPFPDRESMFYLERSGELLPLRENQDILGSRGCPYMCKFCCVASVWGSRKPRLRSVENILREIIFLKTKYGQRFFIFWDELFTINRNRVVELCERLQKDHPDVTWMCEGRIDTIDKALLEIMSAAGCVEIQTGIESGSDRILQLIGKNLTVDLVRKKAVEIRESGIPWRVFLIIGFPSETKDEILRTTRFVEELRPRYMDLSVFCPYPGTAFYNDLKREGRIDENFLKSDFWYPYNNYTGTMTDQEFQELALWALAYADRYNRN